MKYITVHNPGVVPPSACRGKSSGVSPYRRGLQKIGLANNTQGVKKKQMDISDSGDGKMLNKKQRRAEAPGGGGDRGKAGRQGHDYLLKMVGRVKCPKRHLS